MFHKPFVVGLCLALGIALGVTGVAVAQNSTARTAAAASTCQPMNLNNADAPTRWRIEAEHDLDCLIGVTEQALQKAGQSENATVSLTRREVEQIRGWAVSAKAAADAIR